MPVLTRDATRFVGEATFSALASERAHTSLFADPDPIPHTRLGQRADAVVVAPATARLIGSYAAGISDDLLTATLLATRAPVVIAPAMHTEMWDHPAVRDNLATLARRGVHVVPPGEGRLAGGDIGAGRLAEPEDILRAIERVVTPNPEDLAGLHVLVTAGGTREPIDPVRYIGNRSSGKQGHALADEAAERGAKVTLVTTTARPGPAGADLVRVETAADMAAAVAAAIDSVDVLVMAAAVADFRPVRASLRKLRKVEGVPGIVLEGTPDILAELAARKRPGQTFVGFAAETDDLRKNAEAKLASKGVDLIAANDVTATDAGFEHDTNRVTLLFADGTARDVPLADKRQVARTIFDAILERRSNS